MTNTITMAELGSLDRLDFNEGPFKVDLGIEHAWLSGPAVGRMSCRFLGMFGDFSRHWEWRRNGEACCDGTDAKQAYSIRKIHNPVFRKGMAQEGRKEDRTRKVSEHAGDVSAYAKTAWGSMYGDFDVSKRTNADASKLVGTSVSGVILDEHSEPKPLDLSAERQGKLHNLKIDAVPFDDLSSMTKTAEVRNDDRDFMVGDMVRVTDPKGRCGQYTIGHIQRGYGLPDGLCVLSVLNWQDLDAVPATPEDRLKELQSVVPEAIGGAHRSEGGLNYAVISGTAFDRLTDALAKSEGGE